MLNNDGNIHKSYTQIVEYQHFISNIYRHIGTDSMGGH